MNYRRQNVRDIGDKNFRRLQRQDNALNYRRQNVRDIGDKNFRRLQRQDNALNYRRQNVRDIDDKNFRRLQRQDNALKFNAKGISCGKNFLHLIPFDFAEKIIAPMNPLGLARRVDIIIGATGFEPATLCSQSRCATKLRHTPKLISSL